MNRLLIIAGSACVIAVLEPPYSWAAETTPDSAATRCNALGRVDFSNIQDAPTQVTEADLITADGNVPDFCQLRGYITPNVGFKLQLPTAHWNGKFFETGCGGSCGSTDMSHDEGCNAAVRKGYACIASDMGHASGVLDGLWADNNLQAQVDYGYRGAHVTAPVGKAIAERYYGKAPSKLYF
jgi:feruloyl esterase